MALRDGRVRIPATGVQNFTGTETLTIPLNKGNLTLIQLTIYAEGTFGAAVTAQMIGDAGGTLTTWNNCSSGLTAAGREVLTDSSLGGGSSCRIKDAGVTDVDVVCWALYG